MTIQHTKNELVCVNLMKIKLNINMLLIFKKKKELSCMQDR